MSDLIALALYTGVRGCGGPAIPIRAGRKDAAAAGPLGVPKINADQQGLKDTFARMGFSAQDMIKMVACGHTLGGVHPQQFPDIVAPATHPSGVAPFDNTTSTFDNNVAVEFVFTSDGGLTIRQLTDAQNFQTTCKDILQRRTEVVPKGVQLTEPIQVYDVKPNDLSLTLRSNGTILFSGEVRVRTIKRPQASIGSVSLVYKDTYGKSGSTISTTIVGTASGYDDSFTYSFTTSLAAKSSISSFDVVITGVDGSTTSFNNNDKSFSVQDAVFIQRPACSLTGAPDASGKQTAEVVVVARTECSDVNLAVTLQSKRAIPLPLLSTASNSLSVVSVVGDFTYYKGTFNILPEQVNSTTFDVTCQSHGNTYSQRFQRLIGFGLPSSNSTTPTCPTSSVPHGYNGTASSSQSTCATTSMPGPPDSSPGRPPADPAPTDSCGTSAGCHAETWATKTVWAVVTYTNILAYTTPAGICPGSVLSTHPVGGNVPLVTTPLDWATWTSTSTPTHLVVGPTKSLQAIVSVSKGNAASQKSTYGIWAIIPLLSYLAAIL